VTTHQKKPRPSRPGGISSRGSTDRTGIHAGIKEQIGKNVESSRLVQWVPVLLNTLTQSWQNLQNKLQQQKPPQ
jgi:hypothetical protein